MHLRNTGREAQLIAIICPPCTTTRKQPNRSTSINVNDSIAVLMMEGYRGSCLTTISISVTLHMKPINNINI